MRIEGPRAANLLDLLPTRANCEGADRRSAPSEVQHLSLATVIVIVVSGRAALPAGGSCAVGLPFWVGSTTHVSCTLPEPAAPRVAWASSIVFAPDTASGTVCSAPLLV